MHKVTIVCDCCGKEQPDDNQMWEVSYRVRNIAHMRIYPHSFGTKYAAEWCRDCVDKHGLLAELPSPVKPEVKEPTFEDRIIELVRTVVQDTLAEQQQ